MNDQQEIESFRAKMNNRIPMSKIRYLALNEVTGNAKVAIVKPRDLSSFTTLMNLKTEEFAQVFRDEGFIVEEDEVNSARLPNL